MPSNPTDIARYGHRVGMYLDYNGSYLSWIDRMQSLNPSFDAGMEIYYELGNTDPVGASQDPTEFMLGFDQNIISTEAEAVLAGQNPASVTSYDLGDFITSSGSTNAWVLVRDNAGTVKSIYQFSQLTVEELSWRFAVRQPSVFSPRLNATLGKLYTSGSLPTTPSGVNTWGTFNTASAGAVRGRDARIFFGASSGQVSETTNKSYRLQSFNIRATFPRTRVEELGIRALVGQMIDSPEVFVDFDILMADDQPHDQWATLTTGYYDFNQLSTSGVDVTIRLYDPSGNEAASVLRAWRIENCVAVSSEPISAQVRGLTTVRYSLRVAKADTAGSGGLIMFNGKDS